MLTRVHVPSHTDNGKTYVVTTIFSEAVACTCPHFNFRVNGPDFRCKHMTQVETGVKALRLLLGR